jgi:ubiquinone/menaquinone biosynthesis C-methylase UbiE
VASVKSPGSAVADRVQAFYEANPFPGYDLDKYTSREDLRARASPYVQLVDSQVPHQASVADIGCGTGQLACLLALRPRTVVGVDFSSNSLAKGQALKERLGLDNLTFKQDNVLELSLPDATFDYVFCNGVLHHTENPKRGFSHLARIVKPGGYVAVGLYNTYGRCIHGSIRLASTRLGRLGQPVADWGVRHMLGKQYEEFDIEKKRTWWADQFVHPHESVHTVGEVLSWFREYGLGYASSLPPIEPFADEGRVSMFPRQAHPPDTVGRRVSAFLRQLQWVYQLRWTGGYFLVIGKKLGNA